MVQVERQFIKGTPEIEEICFKAARLFNRCNFLMRQEHFAGRRVFGISQLWEMLSKEQVFQQLHNTKTAMQTIRRCLTDWSNFFKSLKVWNKDKTKFLRCPKPPGYKKKMGQVIFFNETIKRKPLKQGLLVPTNLLFSIKSKHCNDFKQVIITPKTFGFVIEVSFEAPKEPKKLKQPGTCAIDLGVNNLCAMTSDQHDPVLIRGGIPKSINQWFNKNRSKKRSRKRYWRLENFFHHTSKFIIENCQANGIGTIIIGRNQGWKQKTKFRRKSKTSQNFQSIPFFKLIEKIQFKAEQQGIKVVFTEEAWTSQASFIDSDPIPVFDKDQPKPQMSGTRFKGLFKTDSGAVLNADVNGSLNIARKVIPKIVEDDRWSRSVSATPVVVNPLKWFHLEKGSMESGLMART